MPAALIRPSALTLRIHCESGKGTDLATHVADAADRRPAARFPQQAAGLDNRHERRKAMNFLFNGPHYAVVEFPNLGYELIDKNTACGAFIQGEVADKFRRSMADVMAQQTSDEAVDAFLDNYQHWMTQRVRFH